MSISGHFSIMRRGPSAMISPIPCRLAIFCINSKIASSSPQVISLPSRSESESIPFSYPSITAPTRLPVEIVSIPNSSHSRFAESIAAKLSIPKFGPSIAHDSYSGPSSTVPVYFPFFTRQMLPQHMGHKKHALSPIL